VPFQEEQPEDGQHSGAAKIGYAVVGVLIACGLGYAGHALFNHDTSTPRQVVTSVIKIALPPPPPPPPPPPQATPPKEDQKLQEKPKEPQPLAPPKPQSAPPKAANPNPAPPGNPLTAAAGNGPSAYGLGIGNGSGDSGGGGGGGGGWGLYNSAIAQAFQAAFRRDDRTRNGRFDYRAKIWTTPTGQVSRVEIESLSGDATRSDIEAVLASVSLPPAPPGFPQPTVIHGVARPT